MELEDFKTKKEVGEFSRETGEKSLGGMMEQIRKQDENAGKRLKQYLFMMLFLSIIYLAVFVQKGSALRDGYALLILGFIVILLLQFLKLRRMQKIDYSAPSLAFLKDAKKRMTFMSWSDWMMLILFLCISGTGGGIIVWVSFAKYMANPWPALAVYLLVLAGAIAVGLYAGKKEWKKNTGQTYSNIETILMNLDKENH